MTITIITTNATKMTSNDDSKKHTVSNWFSSLRRQPKSKKSTNKPHLQKSCLDLTTIATNSSSLPASITNSPKLRSGCTHFDANQHLLTTKSSDGSQHLPTIATELTPNLNEKLTKLTVDLNNAQNNANVNCIDAIDGSRQNDMSATNVQCGKTVTTITRKITKITVIKNKEQNFRRAGLIFDDNGKLISESIAYQNFTKNFRSNLIGSNVGNDSIRKDSHIINRCDSDIDKATSSTILPPMECNAIVDVTSSSIDGGGSEQSEKSNCSISDRLITSNNLDDDFEFIDSSSSMSDICSINNSAIDDYYFNTLPKLPKSYASIKQQTIQPKLGDEKVEKLLCA